MYSGVARVAEVGGQAGGKVCIRGASVYASPKGRRYIDKSSRSRSKPLADETFGQPLVAFESFKSIHLSKKIYNCTQVDNTLTGLTERSWYITQDQKKYFNANLVPHLETKILLLCGNEQTFPNKN